MSVAATDALSLGAAFDVLSCEQALIALEKPAETRIQIFFKITEEQVQTKHTVTRKT